MKKIIFNQTAKRAQRDRTLKNIDLARKVEYLRDFTAKDLSDRFLDVKRNFENILDFGSSSGNIYKYLSDRRITMFNQSKAQLFRDERNEGIASNPGDHERVVGEMEDLSKHFKDNTFDAVVSNLSLHWENDLLNVLVQARNVLKPDGMFMAAILGGDTLYELRTSMQLAETEREGGVSPHV
jgi:NADH dehydrogenase [ubiquinone] 1 alpha subcomplex assembly factor 5